MKNKKGILILIVLVLIFMGIITYNILSDDNKLTSGERRYINNNQNTIQNINVVNNVNIFGNAGTGVYYEFLHDLEQTYKLNINPITFNYGDVVSGLTLGIKTNLGENDIVFYEDHYVLISKENEVINDYSDYKNKKIGVLNTDLAFITKFINSNSATFSFYDDINKLLDALNANTDINYAILPLTIYLDNILKNNYVIIDHISDAKIYYTLSKDDTELSNIVGKYFNTWKSDNLDAYINKSLFTLFTSSLGISDTEIAAMRSMNYKYGFINNGPYDILMSNNYGGIIATYLNDFSNFSDIEMEFAKYKNLNKLEKAINSGDVELFFNYQQLVNNYNTVDSKILMKYSVLANKNTDISIDSINGLINKYVYVLKGSYLETYLNSISGIRVKTYNDIKDLKKLNKKDEIIVIDKNMATVYINKELSNYTERYVGSVNKTFEFKSKDNTAFYRLFTKYVMIKNSDSMVNKGINNYIITLRKGNIVATVAKYILIILSVMGIVFLIIYKSSKRVKVAKKIKKENKLKFIDQLTSLKNRNYLNEYINNWNNNTIYPQTMIVVDLNNIQFINDTLGYEEGDKQITAAANILIKTQLDNSDIMRTDGNEFLIYLVGYTQKQVTNYIHKLNKEFKKLPYEYGAEFGYSMINDSLKTVEDAILEATNEMKEQKKKLEEEQNG